MIAPISTPLIDGASRVVGEAIFSVESASSYLGVVRSLTGAEALIRSSATHQLAGTVTGPSTLPKSGSVRYLGARWQVSSFAGTAFPAQGMRVYLLRRR
jgi:hypothetical protein